MNKQNVLVDRPMAHSESSASPMDKAWPTPEGTPSRKGARDPEARADPSFGRRPISVSNRSAHAKNPRDDRYTDDRPSVGRSLRRALYRFVLAVLVGVSGTLGWQSYGEQMLATYAPTLAWMFSISPAKVTGAAATASDTTPLAPNLEAVRRSLEQLSAKQDQMAQDIATLQALEDDIRTKMSFTPAVSAPVMPATSAPQPRPPQAKPQPSAMQSPPALRPATGTAVR
jgi:hypothetical protein